MPKDDGVVTRNAIDAWRINVDKMPPHDRQMWNELFDAWIERETLATRNETLEVAFTNIRDCLAELKQTDPPSLETAIKNIEEAMDETKPPERSTETPKISAEADQTAPKPEKRRRVAVQDCDKNGVPITQVNAETAVDLTSAVQAVIDGDTSTCQHCNTKINSENGSKLQDGTWVHVGCPRAPTNVVIETITTYIRENETELPAGQVPPTVNTTPALDAPEVSLADQLITVSRELNAPILALCGIELRDDGKLTMSNKIAGVAALYNHRKTYKQLHATLKSTQTK